MVYASTVNTTIHGEKWAPMTPDSNGRVVPGGLCYWCGCPGDEVVPVYYYSPVQCVLHTYCVAPYLDSYEAYLL